jgi:hypothetical protein
MYHLPNRAVTPRFQPVLPFPHFLPIPPILPLPPDVYPTSPPGPTGTQIADAVDAFGTFMAGLLTRPFGVEDNSIRVYRKEQF